MSVPAMTTAGGTVHWLVPGIGGGDKQSEASGPIAVLKRAVIQVETHWEAGGGVQAVLLPQPSGIWQSLNMGIVRQPVFVALIAVRAHQNQLVQQTDSVKAAFRQNQYLENASTTVPMMNHHANIDNGFMKVLATHRFEPGNDNFRFGVYDRDVVGEGVIDQTWWGYGEVAKSVTFEWRGEWPYYKNGGGPNAAFGLYFGYEDRSHGSLVSVTHIPPLDMHERASFEWEDQFENDVFIQ